MCHVHNRLDAIFHELESTIGFNENELMNRRSRVRGQASQDLEAHDGHLGRFQMLLLEEISNIENSENNTNQLTSDSARVKKDDEYTELEQKMADKYYEQMKNEKPEHVGRFVILYIEKEKGAEPPKKEPVRPSPFEYEFGDFNVRENPLFGRY